MLRLDKTTIDRLDLTNAARREGESPATLLPRGPGDDVLLAHANEFADLLAATLEGGLHPEQPEIVLAAKATRGRRPVAVLSVWERTVYRALTSALAPLLPEMARGAEEFEVFKMAPLEDSSLGFVVMSDVAACYQYLDHGLLREELVAQTGDALVTEAITSLLAGLTDRGFGLPQNRDSSYQLAETLLGLVDRRLRRRNLDVWRYNDDFRLAAATRSDAHTALEQLEVELARIGLVLNEEKTSIRTRTRYEDWALAVQRLIAEVEDSIDIDFATFTEYDETPLEPEDAELKVATAHTLLESWSAGLQDQDRAGRTYGPEAAVQRQILSAALVVLSTAEDTGALENCNLILANEPSLTPQVARYFTALMPTAEELVDPVLNSILDDAGGYLSPWQAIWLCEPLRSSTELTQTQADWLRACFASDLFLLRGSAGDVLAQQGEIRPEELAAEFDAAPQGARPKLVAAVASAAGDPANQLLRSITDARPFYRWIAESILGPA